MKTENTHPMGPWGFGTEPQPNGCPIVGDKRGLMVCMLAHSVKHADQKETALANARLIAAAPELLEALKEAQSHILDMGFNGGAQIIAKARAAIARAKEGK